MHGIGFCVDVSKWNLIQVEGRGFGKEGDTSSCIVFSSVIVLYHLTYYCIIVGNERVSL